jgi:dCMP deaminase
MASQTDLDNLYMGTAILNSKLSKAKRSKVGACLVTQQGICLPGFNGQPRGIDNNCEEITGWDYTTIYNDRTYIPEKVPTNAILTTKPSVIHAELNCIMKAAREGVSCLGSTMYVTLSPCVPCSAMMVNAGITRLIYKEPYRDTKGLDLLREAGIIVETFKGD